MDTFFLSSALLQILTIPFRSDPLGSRPTGPVAVPTLPRSPPFSARFSLFPSRSPWTSVPGSRLSAWQPCAARLHEHRLSRLTLFCSRGPFGAPGSAQSHDTVSLENRSLKWQWWSGAVGYSSSGARSKPSPGVSRRRGTRRCNYRA